MSEIFRAGPADRSALIETLAQAFQTDPALSWILPDPGHRATRLVGCNPLLISELEDAPIARDGVERDVHDEPTTQVCDERPQ